LIKTKDDIICKICNQSSQNLRCFAKHLKFSHKTNSETYYCEELSNTIGKCLICGKNTKFISISLGYKNTCSHICGGKFHRNNLSLDNDKNTRFKEKVSKNQIKIWESRTSEEKQKINLKSSRTNKEKNSLLSKEERIERFGWMNKLSEIDKKNIINYIYNKSLRKFYNETPEDILKIFYINRGKSNRKYDYTLLTDYNIYCKNVRYLTEKNYKKFKSIINPYNLKRSKNEYHLDHKVSIIECFKENIDINIASSAVNLQMLFCIENASKNYKSSISIKELYEMYEEYG
jgi:hypothetical protein